MNSTVLYAVVIQHDAQYGDTMEERTVKQILVMTTSRDPKPWHSTVDPHPPWPGMEGMARQPDL